jgi:hypothetical protein
LPRPPRRRGQLGESRHPNRRLSPSSSRDCSSATSARFAEDASCAVAGVRHQPNTFYFGGTGGGVWKTTDGGSIWEALSDKDFKTGSIGAIAVSAWDPNVVYVGTGEEPIRGNVSHGDGAYKSTDGGQSWKNIGLKDSRQIARIRIHRDTVYLPNVYMHKSTDGGRSFSNLPVPHGDNHDLWIDPDDPNRMILGNDGGATITYNGGRSWSTQDNQPTAQFYRVAVDDQFPYWVYGSQQDNSNVCIPSGVPGSGIEQSDWHSAGGGESGWIAPDPRARASSARASTEARSPATTTARGRYATSWHGRSSPTDARRRT